MPSRRNDIVVPLLTGILDAVAIELAFLTSYWLRFFSPLTDALPVTKGFPPLEEYIAGSLFVAPVWIWLLTKRGLYKPRRNVYFSDEFFALVRVVAIGMLVVMSATFFYRSFSFSRAVFALLAVTAVFYLSLGRAFMLAFEQAWYRRGRDLQRLLIVGVGETAARIARAIAHKPHLGYRLAGYCASGPSEGLEAAGVVRLGGMDDVPRLVRDLPLDQVLMVPADVPRPELEALIRGCDGLNVELMMVPDLLELLTARMRLHDIEGIPFLRVKDLALSTWNAFVKRAFDVVVGTALVILLSPVLAVLAILVKLTSRGPVFYVQERVGLDGRAIRVIKFRSMRTDAEAATGPVWAVKNDPRTTSIGRFLRRFSLDELPQLFNVVRGDMSLVGPRPERPHFVAQFQREVPKYLERHRVRSGMTGWAQVNGLRGNAPIEERTRYDVYYVENWSLVFDLKIILKTIRAVLFGGDAY